MSVRETTVTLGGTTYGLRCDDRMFLTAQAHGAGRRAESPTFENVLPPFAAIVYGQIEAYAFARGDAVPLLHNEVMKLLRETGHRDPDELDEIRGTVMGLLPLPEA